MLTQVRLPAVAQREQLSKRAAAIIGFVPPNAVRPGSPDKDLIPALRSDSLHVVPTETALQQLSDIVASKAAGRKLAVYSQLAPAC